MNENKTFIHVDKREDEIIITFEGRLEYRLIEDIKKDLQSLNLETEHGFILNMDKVTYVDSTGFGMIVNFAKRVSARDKKIAIIVNDEFVKKLFSISQVDKVFPIVGSFEEALNVLKGDWKGEISLSEY